MIKTSYVAALIAAAALGGAANASTTNINFDDGTAPGFTGSYTIFTNSVPNVAASVNGSPFLAVPADGASSGTATFTSAKALTSFSFDWGSPDSYNSLTFSGTGGAVNPVGYTGPVTGSNVVLNGGRATFTFAPGAGVTQVNFGSSQRAFEIDNVSAAVPEPAAWALMIVGFAMVGVSSRRRSVSVTA